MTELSILLIYSDLKLSDYFRNETFVPKWLSKDRFIFSIHIAWKYEIEGSESIVGKSLYAGCININLITAALKNIEGRMIFFFLSSDSQLRNISGRPSLGLDSGPHTHAFPLLYLLLFFSQYRSLHEIMLFLFRFYAPLSSNKQKDNFPENRHHIPLDHFFITTTKTEPGI